MRIGIDLRLAWYQTAGITKYSLRLLSALVALDQTNSYVLLQHRKQTTPLGEGPTVSFARLLTPPHSRFEQWPFSIETRFLNLDLIHCPDFIPPLHNKIPAVITVHDLAFLRFPNFVTPAAAHYYGQLEDAVKRASRIIAVSQSTKNDLIELIGAPENKIDVIYEAADPAFRPISHDQARKMLSASGFDAPERFILFVGTIEPRKNLDTLIRAYHKLKRDYDDDLPLLLAGAEGWLSDSVHSLIAELGLKESVLFLGKMSDDQVLALYNLATLLAHPAHYEGFGLTPLEAMACATPVVCSDAGSLPEVVGNAALLAPPQDVEAWTIAMHRLITDAALRAAMAQKGLARARQFSWEKAARETQKTYNRAVG